MNLNAIGPLPKLLILIFMLFYLASVARLWYRAWFRPVSELLSLSETTGRVEIRPLRWLEARPTVWRWLNRLSVTLGLLLALFAVGVLILNLLGLFP